MDQMILGKRIINLDETSLSFTNHKLYSWSERGKARRDVFNTLRPRISITVVVDTDASLQLSMMQGNVNQATFMLSLLSLIMELRKQDKDWRSKCFIVMDGATSHCSRRVKVMIRKLKLPIQYSSPHSPQLATSEKVFMALKNSELNKHGMECGKK